MQTSTAAALLTRSLEDLTVENTFVSELPGDLDSSNIPRQVHGALWTPVEPTPVHAEPTLIAASSEVCELLGLDSSESDRPEFPLIFSGNAALPGGKPYAQVRTLVTCLQLHI
jgi:serine/tyrosine/threonine adenylyltransferase